MEVTELVESKKKTEKKIEENKATFPAQTFVNQWGFIHLSPKAIEAFGATKGQKTPITIDLSEGALIIKKA
jgi:hypothetical protein